MASRGRTTNRAHAGGVDHRLWLVAAAVDGGHGDPRSQTRRAGRSPEWTGRPRHDDKSDTARSGFGGTVVCDRFRSPMEADHPGRSTAQAFRTRPASGPRRRPTPGTGEPPRPVLVASGGGQPGPCLPPCRAGSPAFRSDSPEGCAMKCRPRALLPPPPADTPTRDHRRHQRATDPQTSPRALLPPPSLAEAAWPTVTDARRPCRRRR